MKNRRNDPPYFFRTFNTAAKIPLAQRTKPERASYFEHPHQVTFNPNFRIVIAYKHIDKRRKRLPKIFQNYFSHEFKAELRQAVENTKKRLLADYSLAIASCYNNDEGQKETGLLIPLYLASPFQPSVVLALKADHGKKQYLGATCLTLEMAYQSARTVRRLNHSWLHAALFPPEKTNLKSETQESAE